MRSSWKAALLVMTGLTLAACGSDDTSGGSTTTTGQGGGATTSTSSGMGGQGGAAGPVCGDGAVAGDEGCDDGNTAAGDGCGASCLPEAGFSCSGAPSVCTTTCGDGFVAGNEACDDHDAAPGDGCDASCAVETGYKCLGEPSDCLVICGDGLLIGGEVCDDGNGVAGDGCDAKCAGETGWDCTGEPSACVSVCGDGLLVGAETCDDLGMDAGDGCDASCAIETGYACDGAPSTCLEVCGDGLVVGVEQCDDSASLGGDGCDALCLEETGWDCTGSPSQCLPNCGDAMVLGGEACDDGALAPGDGCDGACAKEMGWACAGSPSVCNGICGDGALVGVEECDDGGVVAGDGCNPNCTEELGYDCSGTPSQCAPNCGDGLVKGLEACDDGDQLGGDGCDAGCAKEVGWSCSGVPSLCVPVCGDTLLTGNEQCDDGALLGGDGCSASCVKEAGWSCSGSPSVCVTSCGDSIVAGNETCDDGNAIAGDCCSIGCGIEAGCEVEPNDTFAIANAFASVSINSKVFAKVSPSGNQDWFSVVVPVGTTGTIVAATGAGVTDQCKTQASGTIDTEVGIYGTDGTTVLASNDDFGANYCSSATAQALPPGTYFVRARSSSVYCAGCTFNYSLSISLTLAICGNGVLQPGEQCDDGNLNPGDGCDGICHLECTSEAESNGTYQSANPRTAPTLSCGAITPIGDEDWYSVTLSSTSDLRVETFAGGYGACATDDTELYVYGTNGTTQLAFDDDDGIGNCSILTSGVSPYGAGGNDAGVKHLPAGTYYVRVKDLGNNGTIGSYHLQVLLDASCGNGVVEGAEECELGGATPCTATCDRVPSCGDGFVDAPEGCDDGNMVSNDGCSSSCVLEICPSGTPYVFVVSDVPKSILDNTTVTSQVTVPNVGVIKKIFLNLNITHTYDGDLDISLITPSNTSINVSSDNGSSGDNYTNTTFDDACATAITAGVAPFTGCFTPQVLFSTVNNQTANGLWKLSIADDAGGDTGSLTAWTLTLCIQ